MRKFLKLLGIFVIFPIAGFAQSPPQIPLTGNIGVQGSVAILGGTTVQMPSDANYTLTPAQWSNKTLIVTSATSLTATRNIVAPLNKGQEFNVENNTTGGQSITVIGSTGTGVTVANGSSLSLFSDGVNYIQGSSSGNSSVGSPGTLQSAGTGGAFSTASTLNVMTTLGNPPGHRTFGDSLSWGIGSTSTGPSNAGAYNGFAYIAGRAYGGTFVNMGTSGWTLSDINAGEIYTNEIPTLGGPSYTLEAGTNDTHIGTPSSTSQSNLFSRGYLAALVYLGTANSQKVGAQSATCSGTCSIDNTYGQGFGSFSTTNGTSWTFSFTAPQSNDSAYACYLVNNAWTTSTFTLALDGTNQNDPFGGTTSWSGSPDITPIPTSASKTATPVCARFTGLASGAHTFKFTVTGSTGTTSEVEPLYVVPAPIQSAANPSIAVISLNLQPSSNTSAPYVSTLTTIIQGLVTNVEGDGLNAFYVDTQDALLNSNVAISLPETLSTTTYTQPGWVSDGGVEYLEKSGTTFVPLALVSGSPSAGQYSVSSGVYTFNAADENIPLQITSTVNCGSGSLSTMVTNCIFTDGTGFHPNNTGHAVMANVEITAARSRNLISNSPNSFFSSDMNGGYNLNASSSPSDWTGPNQFNAGLNGNITGTGLARGIAWGKQVGGKVWGTTMTGNGTTDISPAGVPQYAWCQYVGAVPNSSTPLTCPNLINSGIFEMGVPAAGAGNFALGVAPNSVIFGQGTSNAPVLSYSTFTWLPQTAATSSINQPSPILCIQANVFTTASSKDCYNFRNTTTNGSQNTVLTITASNGTGSGTHTLDTSTLDQVKLPPNTTVGGVNIGGFGTSTFLLGSTAQVGTGATTPACNVGYVCNSNVGNVSFNTGTGSLSAGVVLSVTTGITRSYEPSCTVNVISATYVGAYVSSNETTLSITTSAPLTASTAYTFIWNCGN